MVPLKTVATNVLVALRAPHRTLPEPSPAQLGLEVMTLVPEVTFQPPHAVPLKTFETNACCKLRAPHTTLPELT